MTKAESNSKHEPALLTVVIPAKNEIGTLTQTINALNKEKEDFGLIEDIILVDNHSADGTFDLAQTLPCTTIQSSGSVGHIRNVGANLAKSPYVAFIDADVVIRRGWSTHILRELQDKTDQSIRSNIITGSTCDIPENANWLERTWFGSLASRTDHHYINSGNLVIDHQLFKRISGFNDKLVSGEDVDLSERAKLAGGELIYNPCIQAVHLGYPKDLGHFFNREVWHGREMIKDIYNPLANKALLLAILHLGIIVTLIALLFSAPPYGLTFMLCYPLIPLTLAAIRLRRRSGIQLFQLGLLISVYSFARLWSLLKSLPSLLKKQR